MRTRRTAVLLIAGGLVLAACGSEAADQAGDVADSIAEEGVAALAVGRWHCETDQVEHGADKHISTEVAIADDGRFTYEVAESGDGPLVGTWAIEDLELRLSVPWHDDGQYGFENWIYHADAEAPTRLDGKSEGLGVHDLDVDLGREQIKIHQDDDGGEIGGVAYTWDVTCDRTSSDPGDIGPTIPASTGGD